MMSQGNTIPTERPLIPLREAHPQLLFACEAGVISSRVIPTKKGDSHMLVATLLSEGKVYNLTAFRIDPNNNPIKLEPNTVYVFDRVRASYGSNGTTMDLILDSATRSKCTPVAKMGDRRFNGAYSMAKLPYADVASFFDLKPDEKLSGINVRGVVSGIGITRTIKENTDQEKQVASLELSSFDGSTSIEVVRFYKGSSEDPVQARNPLGTAVIGNTMFVVGASISRKQLMINDSTWVKLVNDPQAALPQGAVPKSISHPIAGTFIDDQEFTAQKVTSLHDIVRIKTLVIPDKKGKFTMYVGVGNVAVRDIGLPFPDFCRSCRTVIPLGSEEHSGCEDVSHSVEFQISDGTTTIDIKGGMYLGLQGTEWADFGALCEELRAEGGLPSVREKLKSQSYYARICINHYPATDDRQHRNYLSLSSLSPAGVKLERRVIPRTSAGEAEPVVPRNMETCD